jgi:hypothetical protein
VIVVVVVVGEIALPAGRVLEVLDDKGGCVMVTCRLGVEVA